MRRHSWYVPIAFIGPVLLVQVTFLFLPLINTFILSFTNAQTVGGGQFIGLDNFVRLAADSQFWAAVGRSALYVIVVVPTITALAEIGRASCRERVRSSEGGGSVKRRGVMAEVRDR